METLLIQAAIGILVIANLVSFAAYAIDKHRARRDRTRISETRLLQLSFLGPFGSIPGIWWLRHKTCKAAYLIKYVFVVGLSMAGHVCLGYFAFLGG